MAKDTKSNGNPQLEKLEQQIAELTNALQRERADSENIRRRHEQEVTQLRSSVKAHVVKDLLPVIDNFERALKHVPPTANSRQPSAASQTPAQIQDWIKGVESIKAQFDKVLASLGVERIKTVGQAFDPHLHEAVSAEEGEGTREVVSEELQAGYKIGSDVIRHAVVRVKMQ